MNEDERKLLGRAVVALEKIVKAFEKMNDSFEKLNNTIMSTTMTIPPEISTGGQPSRAVNVRGSIRS